MKSTKFLKILIIALIIILGVCLGLVYFYIRQQDERVTFFGKTMVNGSDVSDETPQQVLDSILKTYAAKTVIIRENGEENIKGDLAYFGYLIDSQKIKDQLEDCLAYQKSSFITMFKSLAGGNDFKIDIPYTYHDEIYKAAVNVGALKEDRFPSVDSELKYDKKKQEYSITKEVYGNEMEETELQDFVHEELLPFVTSGSSNLVLTLDIPDSLYIKPQITDQDIELNNLCNIYNRFCKASVTYLFGTQKEKIDWDTIKDWILIENGEGVISREKLGEYVMYTGQKYNTLHLDRKFTTTAGNEITIDGSINDYGYMIDEEAEVAQLAQDIASNEKVEREPIYISTISDYGNPVYYSREGTDDLNGNYVEISIAAQHLWFYVDGSLVVESDIVSGCVAKKSETAKGVFPLAYKESPSVLVGADAADGYRTEVTYWMPFYDGQGLHDANWRGSFGGQIYMTNGSHGCVNLPPAAAQTIYSYIKDGMAIVIY